MTSKQKEKRVARFQQQLTNRIPPSTPGRKSMRGLDINAVQRALNKQTGLQALKFMHPRKMRNAVLQHQVPEHVAAKLQEDAAKEQPQE